MGTVYIVSDGVIQKTYDFVADKPEWKDVPVPAPVKDLTIVPSNGFPFVNHYRIDTENGTYIGTENDKGEIEWELVNQEGD